MKNLWKNKDIISTCIKIEIFRRKVIFQMNSMGQFERKTVVGVESAVHSDAVYDVALLLSGTCKKVSIKEIGKTIFVWDFHVGQKMYVLDYWCREHLEHKKLTVCSAEIICVSEKRQIIKVIIENGKKRTYRFNDYNRLFFANSDEATRATSKFPLYLDGQLTKRVNTGLFTVPIYKAKWRKIKGTHELFFYLVDEVLFHLQKLVKRYLTKGRNKKIRKNKAFIFLKALFLNYLI